MHYFIDPKIIYLISIANSFRIVAMVGLVVSIILFVLFTLGLLMCLCESTSDEEVDTLFTNLEKKIYKIVCIILLISTLMTIFIPDENTCKAMIVASFVTEENVKGTEKEIENAIDYIFEKVEQLQEGDSNEDNSGN